MCGGGEGREGCVCVHFAVKHSTDSFAVARTTDSNAREQRHTHAHMRAQFTEEHQKEQKERWERTKTRRTDSERQVQSKAKFRPKKNSFVFFPPPCFRNLPKFELVNGIVL